MLQKQPWWSSWICSLCACVRACVFALVACRTHGAACMRVCMRTVAVLYCGLVAPRASCNVLQKCHSVPFHAKHPRLRLGRRRAHTRAAPAYVHVRARFRAPHIIRHPLFSFRPAAGLHCRGPRPGRAHVTAALGNSWCCSRCCAKAPGQAPSALTHWEAAASPRAVPHRPAAAAPSGIPSTQAAGRRACAAVAQLAAGWLTGCCSLLTASSRPGRRSPRRGPGRPSQTHR